LEIRTPSQVPAGIERGPWNLATLTARETSKRRSPRGDHQRSRSENPSAGLLRDRSAAPSGKPSTVGPMVGNFNDNDVALTSVADNRVEEPPEGGQILNEKVFQTIPLFQRLGNHFLLDYFAMSAIGK